MKFKILLPAFKILFWSFLFNTYIADFMVHNICIAFTSSFHIYFL